MRAASTRTLPYTPAQVDLYRGGDLIDCDGFRSLARYGARIDAHRLVQAALGGRTSRAARPVFGAVLPAAIQEVQRVPGQREDRRYRRDRVVRGLLTESADRTRASGRSGGARRFAARATRSFAIDGAERQEIGAAGLRDALRGKIGTTVRHRSRARRNQRRRTRSCAPKFTIPR
jgi:hypothetical protein